MFDFDKTFKYHTNNNFKRGELLDNLKEEIKPPMLYKVIYREIAMA
jgi:uncharacterized protein YeeX (DUF496 family)